MEEPIEYADCRKVLRRRTKIRAILATLALSGSGCIAWLEGNKSRQADLADITNEMEWYIRYLENYKSYLARADVMIREAREKSEAVPDHVFEYREHSIHFIPIMESYIEDCKERIEEINRRWAIVYNF